MDDATTRSARRLYDEDFYAWTQEQAGILRQGRLAHADLDNILEEIETLGRKEISELRSLYRVLLQPLLKEAYQPERSSRSWKTTILNQRIEIARHIQDNPSLKAKADRLFAGAYSDARVLAASETDLPTDVSRHATVHAGAGPRRVVSARCLQARRLGDGPPGPGGLDLTDTIQVRPAAPSDAALIFGLVLELARYERLIDDVASTSDLIAAALFSEPPKVFCDIVESNGVPAGFAIWFYNFSTFQGCHGIYLEDLFVLDDFRGRGLGKALLARLARRCLDENLPRLEWSVLDWNTPSIEFYRAQGARLLDDWTTCRVTSPALDKLSEYGTGSPGSSRG